VNFRFSILLRLRINSNSSESYSNMTKFSESALKPSDNHGPHLARLPLGLRNTTSVYQELVLKTMLSTPISEEGQEIPLTGRQALKKAWSSPSCQKERSCNGLEEATTTELYPGKKISAGRIRNFRDIPFTGWVRNFFSIAQNFYIFKILSSK
jgi:hypothetical protein